MDKNFVKKAEEHLAKVDPLLGGLVNKQQLQLTMDRGSYLESLCRSIIGQQVSVAAATAIYNRFSAITQFNPKVIAQLTDEQSKEIGLSKQKKSYLTDLAAHFVEDPKVYNHLDKLSDNEVIQELVEVRGIGMWTAQMFLMFTLHRPDVFAPDDVGLQRAMMNVYGWRTLPAKAELIKVAEAWSPYRTVASFHLWQSLNNQPI